MSCLLSSFAVGVVQVRASQGRRGRDYGWYCRPRRTPRGACLGGANRKRGLGDTDIGLAGTMSECGTLTSASSAPAPEIRSSTRGSTTSASRWSRWEPSAEPASMLAVFPSKMFVYPADLAAQRFRRKGSASTWISPMCAGERSEIGSLDGLIPWLPKDGPIEKQSDNVTVFEGAGTLCRAEGAGRWRGRDDSCCRPDRDRCRQPPGNPGAERA